MMMMMDPFENAIAVSLYILIAISMIGFVGGLISYVYPHANVEDDEERFEIEWDDD